MVSLKKVKKEPKMYEITPVHLADEVSPMTQTQIDDTQLTGVKDDSENKIDRFDKRDLIEAIIIAVVLTAFLLFIGLFFGKFLSEGFQLAKEIAFGNS